MISKLNLLLCTAVLAALLMCTHGAPVQGLPAADGLEGEPSGEVGEKTSDLLNIWKALAEIAHRYKSQFQDEFHENPIILESYKSPLFPVRCPESNSSKEACFKILAEGLSVYVVLLKHVEKEYPNNRIVSAARSYSKELIPLIKANMKRADQVTTPTSNQEEQLLKAYDKSDAFSRKMAAHAILHHLRKFLADGKRAISKWEARSSTQLIYDFNTSNVLEEV